MTEVRSLEHPLSNHELFKLNWTLRMRRILVLTLIEMPLIALLGLLSVWNWPTTIVLLLLVPAINVALAWLATVIMVKSKMGDAGRISRTYTFDSTQYRIETANGMTGTIPYAAIHNVRKLGDGTLIEVSRGQGHWIRPRHFETIPHYENALGLVNAARSS